LRSTLRTEAIRAIGQLGDPRSVGFLQKLLETEPRLREEIYGALGRIGRPASLFLKTKLDDPDPGERLRALNTLLGMATQDDLSALYAYIAKHPPSGDLKKKVYDAIASLEVSLPN